MGSLTGQRHDRDQTGAKLQPWTAVSTLLGLFSTVLQAVKFSADRLIFTNTLYAGSDDLRRNSDPNPCQLAHVTCKTRDKGEYYYNDGVCYDMLYHSRGVSWV